MSNATPSTPPPAAAVAEHDALPPGTRFGEFEILRVLGVGGFGIVYLTQDHSLERQVALKEYMPAALASRGVGPVITVRSASFAETYAIGLRSFVNEARLLARFDHPSLVKVYRFWEDNATAYMVMPYLQGITLRDARKAMAHAPDEAWIMGVIHPMLDALELLHREGVFHRDIAPDNILLPPEGQPILLDFGAARHVISDRTQSLTAILKPSYAPIEQYAEMTQMRQGPWTDLYALGAVMHFLLFGVPPAPATARAMQDDAEPIEQRVVPGVSQRLLEAVGWTLRVRPLERPQNVAELRAALKGLALVPARASASGSGQGGVFPGPAAPSAVTFQPTMMVDAADPQATRIDPTQTPAPRVAPPPPPRPATVMPAAPQRLVAAAPPAASPAAPASKRGPVMAALAAAVVVAGVVLWQFVGLLGGARAPALAGADAASAAASVAAATPAVTQAIAPAPVPAVAVAAPSPSAAASTQAATEAALAAVAQAQGLAVPGKAASGDAGKSPAMVAAAPAAAVAASTVRNKPNPGVAVPRAENNGQAANAYGDAASKAAADARARPVPAAAPREPVAVAAPVAAAPAVPATAREKCGSRLFIALALCMDRECEQPRYREHPECVQVLETKRKRENPQ